MTGKPEFSVHKAAGNSSYCIKMSSLVVSTGQPTKLLSEIKLEKISLFLDLGLNVVAQEVITEELEVDTEEYSTNPITPETDVETKEVIGNKM